MPRKVIGKSEEVVLPALFLAGDGSDHITGQLINMRTIG